jgi:hypothetical protein
MRILALVLVSMTGCAAPSARVSEHHAKPPSMEENRVANLKRAAQYPWTDDGVCAVREAGGDWKTLVEKCYGALDLSRIRFQDLEHRCPVAQVNAATIGPIVGICLLVQPEIVVGAVIVIGVVVIAAAIAEELSKYCDCYCGETGFVGNTVRSWHHIGLTKDAYTCNWACVDRSFLGGGICK